MIKWNIVSKISEKDFKDEEPGTIMKISVISPVYNEEQNIETIYRSVKKVLSANFADHELLFVNDGSTDSSGLILNRFAKEDPSLRVIHFKKNIGQTPALQAGFDHASGDILVTIDSDLQNDPEDIPMLIKNIMEGSDVCSGWRKKRRDNLFLRTIPSWIANRLISKITGLRLHDYGCTLKAYRREFTLDLRLYGEMHRLLPIFPFWQGAIVTELPVNHFPRIYGKSKYGLNRVLKVIFDLIVIKFLERYQQKPIHIFGLFGFYNFIFSFVTFLLMIYFKFWGGKTFIQTPLPILVSLFILIGFLSIFLGLIAEVCNRTYFESQKRHIYFIKSMVNFEK